MPRFLTSNCLWYPTSRNYRSITVLILTSHRRSLWRPQQSPCPRPDPSRHGLRRPPILTMPSRLESKGPLIIYSPGSRHNLIPVSCQLRARRGSSFSWRAARNFFSNFSKEIRHTRESHGEGENVLLLIIFISIEILATHLYVPKYTVVKCTTACTL